MSILQDYQAFKKEIGEEKFKKLEEYLDNHPHLFLSDVMYKQGEWEKFEEWLKGYPSFLIHHH